MEHVLQQLEANDAFSRNELHKAKESYEKASKALKQQHAKAERKSLEELTLISSLYSDKQATLTNSIRTQTRDTAIQEMEMWSLERRGILEKIQHQMREDISEFNQEIYRVKALEVAQYEFRSNAKEMQLLEDQKERISSGCESMEERLHGMRKRSRGLKEEKKARSIRLEKMEIKLDALNEDNDHNEKVFLSLKHECEVMERKFNRPFAKKTSTKRRKKNTRDE